MIVEPFNHERVQFLDRLEIGGRSWLVDDEVSGLAEFMTERRRERIDQIIDGRTRNIATVVENIYDRGNVSAIMRSAEAFGFLDFHVVQQPGAEKFKAANRVSQGAHKWLNLCRHSSAKSCVEELHSRGVKVYATHLGASSQPIDDIDFSQPSAIVFGNEHAGVTDELLELCDGNVIIPMKGMTQSFNISVAGAISFYHINYWRRQQGLAGDLTEQEKQQLRASYYLRSVENSEKLLNR